MNESQKKSSPNSTLFECTICLDTAKEPVVTKCGHIFCWPCIYDWMKSKNGSADCPNCKNRITQSDLTPIYTSGENKSNTKKFDIPERPRGERNPERNNSGFNFTFTSSFANNGLLRGLPENTKGAVVNLALLLFMLIFFRGLL